jgi:hypothetical protein
MFLVGLALVKPASSQVAVYADFSASKLTGGLTSTTTNFLYGPTIGLTALVGTKKNINLSGDLRTGFYGNGSRLSEISVGPKVGLDVKRFEAYTEILVGFARYNDGAGNASTDAQTEVNFGLDMQGKGRLDWRVFEFGYEQYYGLGGEFNPKTFSTGVVVHLGKR